MKDMNYIFNADDTKFWMHYTYSQNKDKEKKALAENEMIKI